MKNETPQKDVLYFLYEFLKDMGLGYLVQDMTKSQRKAWIEKVHGLLIVENDRVPANADYEELYLKFTKDSIYGDLTLKEKTVKGILDLFNTWLQKQNIIRKKALPAPNPDEKKNLHPNLIYWSDYEIQRQISILAKIGMQDFLNTPGGKGYMARLGAEAEKRKLEPVYIKL